MSRMYLFEGKVIRLEKEVKELKDDLNFIGEAVTNNYHGLLERIEVLEKSTSIVVPKSKVIKPGGK